MNLSMLWKDLEASGPRPERVGNILSMDYAEFPPMMEGKAREIKSMIEALYAGDVIILKRAFPSEWMRALKEKTVLWCSLRPSAFHKMLEGSPDFHRIIDHEAGLKYAFRQCKHSAYFYNWNDDPLRIFPAIYARWSSIKLLMGLRSDEYQNNTPKDGVVDRVQVVRYPPGAGYLEPHYDPYVHQRLFISGYMSKRGVDYQGGGFYLVDANDQKVDAEERIEVGDIAIGYATVMHGVAPCEGECDWSRDDGRWFLSLYSNATDYSDARQTGVPARLSIPGTLPRGFE